MRIYLSALVGAAILCMLLQLPAHAQMTHATFNTDSETYFTLDTYPESFSGPRLFSYTSTFLSFGYRKFEMNTGYGNATTHSIGLRPGFSVGFADGKASVYSAVKMKFLAGEKGSAETFRFSSFRAGFNVNIINEKPMALTFGFHMDLRNLDQSEIAGVDQVGLIPYLSTGFGFLDRFFVSPYLALPIGVVVEDFSGQLDHSFAFALGLPFAVRTIDRLYILVELGAVIILEPVTDNEINITPAIAYQTSWITFKFGFPMEVYDKTWAISFYLSGNF